MQEIQVRVSRLAKLVFRQENTKVAPLHQIVFFFSNTEKKTADTKNTVLMMATFIPYVRLRHLFTKELLQILQDGVAKAV